MFVGRTRELMVLEAAYASTSFEYIVMYGQRRLGKTALLNEFSRDKQVVYVTGVESGAEVNLANISRSMADTYPELSADTFRSIRAALEYLFKRSEQEKTVLIIDEYPYVARADRSIASILQVLIDEYKGRSQLKLILSGSSVPFMGDKVLGYKSPLYGRLTGQIRLRPFEFAEARQFVPSMHAEDQLAVYAVTGGVPSYLELFDDTLSLQENLTRVFLNPRSPVYMDPMSLPREELREPAGYNAILSAIAEGAAKFSEIVRKVNMSSAAADAHLQRLIDLGFITRRIPFGSSTNRKTIYEISDGQTRFFYRFVLPNISRLECGRSKEALHEFCGHLSDFVARTFQDVCAQHLWHLFATGRSPVNFYELGAWWGTNRATRAEDKIDIVGMDATSVLTAACEWQAQPVDTSVLRSLRERTSLVSGGLRSHMYIFARNGFTDEIRSEACHDSNVTLASYPAMIEEFDIMV